VPYPRSPSRSRSSRRIWDPDLAASHNDYRYNGYKLFLLQRLAIRSKERDELYNDYILPVKTAGHPPPPLARARSGKLVFLGGGEPEPGVDYLGCERLRPAPPEHRPPRQVLRPPPALPRQDGRAANRLLRLPWRGPQAVPRLLEGFRVRGPDVVTERGLGELSGLFPSFGSEPGKEQTAGSGDPRRPAWPVEAYRTQYGRDRWEGVDILIGTDPDADRLREWW